MNTTLRKFPFFEAYRALSEKILAGNQGIVLFGFGKVGQRVLKALQETEAKIVAILDNNPSLQGKIYQGIPVFSLKEYTETQHCVVVCSDLYFEEMIEQLEMCGFNTYIPHSFAYFGRLLAMGDFYNKLMDMRYMHSLVESRKSLGKESIILRSIDITITEKCSLRCRDCSNLMQYFDKPVHSDLPQTVDALNRLLDTVDYVHEIHVLGGEPFVNTELPAYLKKMQEKAKRFDFILIFTNATVIPKDETLQQLKHDNVVLSITDYENPKQKTAELIELLNREKILYRSITATEWQDCGQLYSRQRTKEQNIEVLHQCCASDLLALKDGLLFRCPFAGNAYALNAVPPEINEYIEIRDPGITREKLRKKISALRTQTFLKACDYCGGRPVGVPGISAAIQAESPLKYKRYTAL